MVAADLIRKPTQLEDGRGHGGSSQTYKSKSYVLLVFFIKVYCLTVYPENTHRDMFNAFSSVSRNTA